MPDGDWLLPTAVHAVADGHDTPVRETPEPDGLGVGWIDHVVPFQRTANVPVPSAWPTAVQALLEMHETAWSLVDVAPAGTGTAWIVQLVPFQLSTSARDDPAAVSYDPTAMHAVPEVQVTSLNPLS